MRLPLRRLALAALLAATISARPLDAQTAPDTAAAAAQDTVVDAGPGSGLWSPVRYFALATASDAWAVTTAPLRLRGTDAWLFGGVLAVGAVLYAFDEPIYEEALRSRRFGFVRWVEDVGVALEPVALMSQTSKYYALGVVAGNVVDQVWGYERPRHIFEELLISHWLASATRKAIGRPLGRRRPDQERGAYYFGFWGGTSFPSGHTSTAMQVAAVLSHHIDYWPATALFYSAATMVAYERLTSANHWPSDIWLGALWGWGIAQIVIDRREADRIDFVPIFDPATGALGLRVPVGF